MKDIYHAFAAYVTSLKLTDEDVIGIENILVFETS